VAKALIEAVDHIEDEGAVGDDLAKGIEVISHLLEAPIVVGDIEVALNEVVKPHLQVDGSCLSIAEKLGLDREPGVTSDGNLGRDDFDKVISEGFNDPVLNDSVHPQSRETGTGGSQHTRDPEDRAC
jgi:hypothetical protein